MNGYPVDVNQNDGMDRDDVMQWIDRYERAWRDGDLDAVGEIFSAEAHYRTSPYEESMIGHAAIKAFWLDDDDVFTMSASPVAVDGRDAVVRVEVRYGEPVRQEYRDLWVLRFDDDGRVEDFEEWAYWPDKPYTAQTPRPETSREDAGGGTQCAAGGAGGAPRPVPGSGARPSDS